jgi:hypothetical protein
LSRVQEGLKLFVYGRNLLFIEGKQSVQPKNIYIIIGTYVLSHKSDRIGYNSIINASMH